MQHRPTTASKPAPRHAPLFAVGAVAVSLFAAAAFVASAAESPPDDPTPPAVEQLPPPAVVEQVGPTTTALTPAPMPTTPPTAADAPADVPVTIAPEARTPDGVTETSTTTVAPARPTSDAAAPSDAASARASDPDVDATVANSAGVDVDAPEPADDEEEPSLPGNVPGQVVAGGVAPSLTVFEPTVSVLEPIVVPEATDLLAARDRRDRRDERDERDDEGTPKPPTAPADDFEWGGDNPAQIAPGCLGGCVTSALIHAWPHTADVLFEITTDTPARFDVTVGKAGTLQKLHVSNGGFDMAWSTTLGPLVAGVEYAILVEVTDQSGYEEILTHWFTAPDPAAPAWDMSGNVTGCAAQCIQHGMVRTTDDPSVVVVEVGTTVPAWVTVSVSKDAPSIVGGVPTLPDSAIVADPSVAGTDWEFDVDGLAPDTLHHVVVQAVDEDGAVAMRAGQFVTDPALPSLVVATFHWIRIEHDGDEGLLGGTRGEIQLGWGTEEGMIGIRSEDKLHAGDVIHLDVANSLPTEVSSTGTFPPLVVAAVERDLSMTSFGQVIPYPAPVSYTEDSFAITVAWTLPMLLDSIDLLASCEEHADGASWEDHRCIVLESAHPSDDHVEFEALISLHVPES